MDFSGAHAIVTGGSSGIGHALVDRLVERDARVSVLALDDADLTAVREEHSARSDGVTMHPVDVTQADQVRTAVAEAVHFHGPCDILVTSAGISRPGHFLELTDEHFERQMAVNYFGTLHAIRAVAPAMIERRTGSIVAISSAAGLLGVFGYSAYGATKYAVRGLCDVLRTELKPKGIYVGCVYPTDVDTPQFAGERPFLPDEALSISGTVKPISADEVALAILKGIERRRANIFTDPTTAVLDRLVRVAPGLTQRWLDHRVGLVVKKQ
ncbi:MAG: SDR family oxidoreductase [Acidimicrobiia bacterium]|jgi:3-dehydrosphinganine reductase